jgi:hypothetical protein
MWSFRTEIQCIGTHKPQPVATAFCTYDVWGCAGVMSVSPRSKSESLRRMKCCKYSKPSVITVAWLGRLVAGFPPRRPGFEPLTNHGASEQASSEYFSFACHSFIPLTAPQSSPSIIQGSYSRPINGRSNSGRGSSPAQ